MKRNQEAIRTKSNAAHAAITELTNIALIAAEKADKAETAEIKTPVITPEAYSRIKDLGRDLAGAKEKLRAEIAEHQKTRKAYSRIEDEALRLADKVKLLSTDILIARQATEDMAAKYSEACALIESLTDDRDDLAHEIHCLKRHIEFIESGRRNDRVIAYAISAAQATEAGEEKDRRIDQLERALCEEQDKLKAEIAAHQRTKELLRCARIDQEAWKSACVSARETSQDLDADNRCMRSERARLMAHLKQIEELARSK